LWIEMLSVFYKTQFTSIKMQEFLIQVSFAWTSLMLSYRRWSFILRSSVLCHCEVWNVGPNVSYQYIAFVFGVGIETVRCLYSTVSPYSTEIDYSWILTSLVGPSNTAYPAPLDLPSGYIILWKNSYSI
jgi:hypothetical protein